MEFRELSDGEWEIIEPPLSPKAKADRSRADDRIVLNGILYVLVTGIPRTNPNSIILIHLKGSAMSSLRKRKQHLKEL